MSKQKTIKISAWVLTGIIAFALTMSAIMKISLNEMGLEQAKTMGMSSSTFQIIGVVELISLIFFIIPRTGVIGTVLLMAYFGGAIAVHILVQQPIIPGLIIEFFVAITAMLRFPELTKRLFTGSIN
jgi:hypothetical protein